MGIEVPLSVFAVVLVRELVCRRQAWRLRRLFKLTIRHNYGTMALMLKALYVTRNDEGREFEERVTAALRSAHLRRLPGNKSCGRRTAGHRSRFNRSRARQEA